MKKDIHPTMKNVKVIMTNGDVIDVRTTYSKGTEMRLDVDPFNHPAWTGKRSANEHGARIDKFKSNFAKFTLKK